MKLTKQILARYYALQKSRKTDNGLTSIQQEELYNLSEAIIYTLLKDKEVITKKLKRSDFNNSINQRMIEEYRKNNI